MATGLLVLISTLTTSGSPERVTSVVRGINAFAVVAGLVLVRARHRSPEWVPHLGVVGGVVLITEALRFSGGGANALAYASVYMLVPVYAYFILPRRAASIHMGIALAVGVPSLALQPGVAPAEEIVLWGVALLLAGAVSWMAHLVGAAEVDAMTGLANRQGLERALEVAMHAGGSEHRPVLALLDIDHFKTVNEDRGRTAGDRLLVEVARTWARLVPTGSTMARLSGDEFGLVLSRISPEDVVALCDELRRSMPAGTTCSAGVAQRDVGEPVSMLLNRTDLAVYTAKREGRARTHLHLGTGEDGEQIQQGLLEEQFVVHFQPIVDPRSNSVVGAEALVRWQHPKRGLVMPDAFIPLAERCGLIVELGQQVLRQACRVAAGWAEVDGVRPYVAVNASGRELQDPGYAQSVLAALQESGLPPERLVLELVESDYDIGSLDLAANLHHLRSAGVRTAMDDFGVGHSSLDRLRHSGVDILKIDRSFVSDISTADADAALMSAIIAMADALGLRIVVEGVETADQAEWILRRSSALIQGWYYARSAPVLVREVGPARAVSTRSSGITAQARS